MLGDIARVSLTAGARLFPEQPWSDLDVSAGSLTTHKSPSERLAFIERVLPLLKQAMAQIRCNPVTAAISQPRLIAPPIRAHRVTTQAVLQAARRGPAHCALEESRTLLTTDTPENRSIQSFLQTLLRDSLAIAQIAEAAQEEEAAGRGRLCSRRLQGLLSLPGWEEVAYDRAAWTKPPIQRASARPEYASLFRLMARYRTGFQFDWDHPWLTLPSRESWRLYETWCLFLMLDSLLTLGYLPRTTATRIITNGTPQDLFTVREGRLTLTLATGSASSITLCSPQGRRLTLLYNQTFAEGLHSLSHTMQPDITLVRDNRIWILDAKLKAYALPGEESEDINQMHAYRDAIVDASGQRNVVHAWCLYAGQASLPNRARITYGRTEETAVGALCFRPCDANTIRNLRALLSGWLSEAPPTPAPPALPQT